MSATVNSCQVIILIKAVPRPSKKYGETVCCAGVTRDGVWKRLYPVRFRQLTEFSQFRRWDLVSFRFRRPTEDLRQESCHVFEDTIAVDGSFPQKERYEFLDRLIFASARSAASDGRSLTIVRPINPRFTFKKKPAAIIEAERQIYRNAGRQTSFLDSELEHLEPTPYAFAFRFEDGNGRHTYQCGDWETQATFRKWQQLYGEAKTLELLSARYNEDYPKKGMVFALGNVLKRQHIWQLLGVIRADEKFQLSLGL